MEILTASQTEAPVARQKRSFLHTAQLVRVHSHGISFICFFHESSSGFSSMLNAENLHGLLLIRWNDQQSGDVNHPLYSLYSSIIHGTRVRVTAILRWFLNESTMELSPHHHGGSKFSGQWPPVATSGSKCSRMTVVFSSLMYFFKACCSATWPWSDSQFSYFNLANGKAQKTNDHPNVM